nr:hypothetical protein [Tanacetum cinerariifolium]
MVSISPEGFLPSILLLVVVIVTVVIVAVILVVVVVAIDGVVIVVMIIGVEFVVTIIRVVVVVDVLGDGEFYQRCTCMRCGSDLSKGLCLICGNNQNSLNDSPSISENSSQSPPHINHHCCYEFGDPLDGIYCHQCTCESCGRDESPFTCDSTPNIVDDSPNVFNPPPQPLKYSYEFCGNDGYYDYDCPPQVPFTYDPEPCYNQDINFPGPHETYQCQPMNEDCYHEQNSCYNSNSFSFDQFLPQQLPQKKEEEEKQIAEEQAAKARYWTIPICYDDDEDYTIAIIPKEPDNSLSMGDEHLDTIPATKSDEFIKSSVENLVPNPSESEGEHEYDVPACDDFTTFSNILFDVDDDFSSSDNQSFYDDDIPKEIYSNPLFDKEIISIKINPHHINAESDLIESLLNHNSSIISSSSKIDSLLDEFVSELTLLKSIPPGINETDCDPEEEIRLIKKLLYDNSSPRLPKEFISKNSDAAIKSFSSYPIPVEDSDSFMEEIDLSFNLDDPMPPGIEEDDYDSEMDILVLEELLSNDSLSLPENELFHFDIPSSSRPLAKPPDGNSGILNVKVMGDISKYNVPMPRLMLTQPTLVPNQEKSPNLLSYQGHKASQPSTECPMMIYRRNTPILDVSFLHFYRP